MTVKELREALAQLDDNLTVTVNTNAFSNDFDYWRVTRVNKDSCVMVDGDGEEEQVVVLS
jgi:hypothetical protein